MHRRARWALVPFYAVRDRALLGGALGKSSASLAQLMRAILRELS